MVTGSSHAAGPVASAEMNVTPMIDILLVLLVIFMVSKSDRMAIEVQVPLPERTAITPYAQIVLELPREGFTVNGQPIPSDELEARLRTILEPRRMRLVFVKAHPERRYQDVITAVDVVRGAGADLVAFTPP